ncbi:MAG: ATP-binding cassette domain-containing protein, partial [Marinilabiliaceae bacterium]|nr:ATP-binding cassette domain-containing protein [Marinilabiliaceae bacterium]
MSDVILDALMQLFALIIDIDENNKISEREKEVVRSFLTQQLNRKLAEKYMIIFEEYLLQFHKDDYYQNPEKKRKRRTLTERKIISICEKINEELQQNQKIYVIIQLIEFISLGELVSEKETEFLKRVSNTFRIPKAEFRNIFSFIVGTVHDIPDKDKVLVVNNKERCHYDLIKHKFEPHISGELFFLRIESTRTYVLRYYGYADIYLNSQNIVSGRTYAFEHGSSVRSQSMKTIFYTDVSGRFSTVEPGSNITVAAKDVTYWFKNTYNGIQKFNMNAKSGTLVAVMGGSGVGKSTLINVLNGTLTPNKG